jgi:hypothetical protein
VGQTLHDLKRHAEYLHQLRAPAEPILIRALCAVPDNVLPILEFPFNHRPGTINAILANVGRRIGEDTDRVRYVLDECLRLDRRNRHEEYNQWAANYGRGPDDEAMARFFRDAAGRHSICYVIYGCIGYWDPEELQRCDLLIDSLDENEEKEYGKFEGYLICQGRGFQTSLELLAAAMKDQWPCWEWLWSPYW